MPFGEPESARIRILHITDALNGGILTALKNLTQNQQKCDHYVLWDSHTDTPVPKDSELTFNNSRMRGGHFSKIWQIKKSVNSIKPDVIHLHSSLAGVYGRIIPLKKPVCYSAHAFAFERRDVSRVQVSLFRIIESMLQVATHTNILLWPIEQKHIRRLFLQKNTVVTDALWSDLISKIRQANYVPAATSEELLVIGRVAPAKDPEFVVKIKKELIKRNINMKIKWYGARDDDEIIKLKKEGIEGLIWTSEKKNLQDQIMKARATLITSKWEVGPYTFYESLSLGRNVVVRDLESLKILGLKCHFSVEEFCDEIESLSDDVFAKKIFESQVKCVLSYYDNARYENIETLYEKIVQDGN